MKTEVIISNGAATLTLTPEFEFERTLIEAMEKDELVVLDTLATYPTTSMWSDVRKHQLQFKLGKKPNHSHEPQHGC